MLGASLLDPLSYIYPYLRVEDEFWHSLPMEDAYVVPTDNYVSRDEGGFEFKPFRRIHSEHYAKLLKKSEVIMPNKSASKE